MTFLNTSIEQLTFILKHSRMSEMTITINASGRIYSDPAGMQYAIQVPIQYAVDNFNKKNETGGYGPHCCEGCRYAGSINGVFVGYCPNCAIKFSPVRGGGIWASDITPETIETLWESFPYMHGVYFHEIGKDPSVVNASPEEIAESLQKLEEYKKKSTYDNHCSWSTCTCYGCKQYRKEHWSEEQLRDYDEWEDEPATPIEAPASAESQTPIYEADITLPEDRMWHIVGKETCLCSQCMTEEQYIDFLDNENRFESWPAHEYDTPAIRAIRVRVNDLRRPYYGDSFISHWEMSDELLNRFMG